MRLKRCKQGMTSLKKINLVYFIKIKFILKVILFNKKSKEISFLKKKIYLHV